MVVYAFDALTFMSVSAVLELLNEAHRQQCFDMINNCSRVLRLKGFKLVFDHKLNCYVTIATR